ncbi:MAG: carbamoyltransferase [Acidobacteriota bacterium]|nr:carbamoyltransferase [Acidobacteriota bacterium]
MNILGIGGVPRDSAAALIKDGKIAAAIEEHKLTRKAEPGKLPEASIAACLKIAGISREDVDFVALARPLPPGPEVPTALRTFPKARVVSIDHHAAHAASAWLASPYRDAVVITLDRAGDLRCGARWRAQDDRLTLEQEILYPNSIGELYGRVTELLGFRPRSDEHLVQWLSAAGEPTYLSEFEAAIKGNFGAEFLDQFGEKEVHANLAASVQRALENYVMELAGDAENVCLAGGIAWNAMLVAALECSGRYKGVFAQPAAGNAGTALGAALHVYHDAVDPAARLDGGGYALGPAFAAEEIKQVLENCKLRFKLQGTTPELIGAAVRQLSGNRILAWMQGRMEFGPRALGHRSILASPRDRYAAENLNTFIKHREGFRKFAASVPSETAAEYFDVGPNARHLATVGRVKPAHKEKFEGALLDGESLIRVHTVEKDDNPLYWRLLHAFGKETGLPVLYNTSFNLFGEPLVCTPRDAVRSFYSSGIDAMLAGNFLLEK